MNVCHAGVVLVAVAVATREETEGGAGRDNGSAVQRTAREQRGFPSARTAYVVASGIDGRSGKFERRVPAIEAPGGSRAN